MTSAKPNLMAFAMALTAVRLGMAVYDVVAILSVVLAGSAVSAPRRRDDSQDVDRRID